MCLRIIRLRRMHEIRTIATDDLAARATVSQSLSLFVYDAVSRGFAVQTRLSGPKCCLRWRLLGTQYKTVTGFDAAFAKLFWPLVYVVIVELRLGSNYGLRSNVLSSAAFVCLSVWNALFYSLTLERKNRLSPNSHQLTEWSKKVRTPVFLALTLLNLTDFRNFSPLARA